MKRHNLKFFQHLWRKSRAAMAKQSKRLLQAIKRGMQIERHNSKPHSGHQPNGRSFKSMRRAFNQGWRCEVEIKPERRKLYLSRAARQGEALRELIALRR